MRSKGAKNLCSAVAGELGRRIVAGRIKPGDPVPTEAALCATLGVSRTTVREAVKRLHGKGLVDGSPRNGTRVLPTLRWNQFDTDILAWRVEAGVDAALLDELYEIRDCFEPRACSLAASRGSAEERETIERHYNELATQHFDAERHIAADLNFHLAIFVATQNRFFISLGAAIATALRLSFALRQQRIQFPPAELLLHGDVARAIAARQADAAERAMRMLLQESRRTLGIALHDGDHRRENTT